MIKAFYESLCEKISNDPELPSLQNSNITVSNNVIGIKFDSGVIIAADNLICFNNLNLSHAINRVFKINEQILFSGIGDIPDLLSIKKILEELVLQDTCWNDGITLKPESALNWLHTLNRARRAIFSPLFVELVVGGIRGNGLPILGKMDVLGRVTYMEYAAIKSFNKRLVLTLVKAAKPKHRAFKLAEAIQVIGRCMKALYYRNSKSVCHYTVGICTACECIVKGPFKVDENWDYASRISGYY